MENDIPETGSFPRRATCILSAGPVSSPRPKISMGLAPIRVLSLPTVPVRLYNNRVS
jgi:hypothetical protein